MSENYIQLLDATIQHIEALKSRGVRNIAVAPETLRALTHPAKTAAAPKSPVPNRLTPIQSATSAAAAPAIPRIESTYLMPPRNPSAPVAPKPRNPEPGPQIPIISAWPKKAAAFTALRARVLSCTKCPHLACSRSSVVFGVGNVDARIVFIGEAPGADEDEQGEPFVGRAGQLLSKIIEATGLTRSDVYIANILKCRPDTPGQSAGNRPPTTEERATCIPYLQEQIDLIQPAAIVALGATAVDGLLGKTLPITKLRGNWQAYRGIPLMPTYHPAYLLRNQAMSEKRKVWEDILKVMEKLEMPISGKQRNFFLKA
jgi:DNA polymerase